MSFPINPLHRLLLESGSKLLLEDGTSFLVLDEIVALDDPLNTATGLSINPTLTFLGQNSITRQIGLIAHTSVVGGTGNITSTGIDTSDANFIVLNTVFDSSGAIPTISDNKGNAFINLPPAPIGSAARIVQTYCIPQMVGSGHTFTVNGGNLSTMEVAAFNGIYAPMPYRGQIVSNSNTNAVTTFQAGSIMPASGNVLIIASLGMNAIATPTSIDSSFTKLDEQNFGAANNYGSAMAYLIQSGTPSAVNPTWTRTGTGDTNSAITSVFLGVPALTYEIQIDTTNTFDSQ